MSAIDWQAKDFLTKERVCSLTVILEDGSPHSAAVHFSFEEEPFRIFFQTSDDTVKAQPFLDGKSGPASVVLGFSESEWLTLQMRGQIRRVTDAADLEKIFKIHYAKNPEAEQYKDESTVILEFWPLWYRYSDFKAGLIKENDLR